METYGENKDILDNVKSYGSWGIGNDQSDSSSYSNDCCNYMHAGASFEISVESKVATNRNSKSSYIRKLTIGYQVIIQHFYKVAEANRLTQKQTMHQLIVQYKSKLKEHENFTRSNPNDC